MADAQPKANGSKKPEESHEVPRLEISRIAVETILVPIKGTAPLIVNNFSEKSKIQLLDSQQGKKSPKEVRDPQAEYEAALYRLDEFRYGFPTVGFKACTVSAARFFGKDVTMTALKLFMFFRGEMGGLDTQMLTHIIGEPKMREDVVRLAGPSRSATMRFRPEFTDWSATLRITYVTNALSRDSVLSLVDAGGLGVGVGEWRPERNGTSGTFTLDWSRNLEVVG